jgi:hypothetical protein
VGVTGWWVACVMVCAMWASEIGCMHAIKALLILYFLSSIKAISNCVMVRNVWAGEIARACMRFC